MRKQNHPWYLIWMLSKTDFALRYHGSILGFLWAVLRPLSLFIILNFVFSRIFAGGTSYALGLLTALTLWNYFAEATMTGVGALLSKGHILKKIHVPAWTMVLASFLSTSYTFLLSLGILACFFVLYGVFPSIGSLLLVLPYLMLLGLMIVATIAILAPIYVRLRDLNQVWEVLLQAGFYATPIIYPLSVLPSDIAWILGLSPLTIIIEGVKGQLLGTPSLPLWPLACLPVLCVGSWILFRLLSRGIAEYV